MAVLYCYGITRISITNYCIEIVLVSKRLYWSTLSETKFPFFPPKRLATSQEVSSYHQRYILTHKTILGPPLAPYPPKKAEVGWAKAEFWEKPTQVVVGVQIFAWAPISHKYEGNNRRKISETLPTPHKKSRDWADKSRVWGKTYKGLL